MDRNVNSTLMILLLIDSGFTIYIFYYFIDICYFGYYSFLRYDSYLDTLIFQQKLRTDGSCVQKSRRAFITYSALIRNYHPHTLQDLGCLS